MARIVVKTDRHVIEDVVIAAGEALSNVIETNGLALVAIEMPAAWTAANIAYLGGSDPEALLPLYSGAGDRQGAVTGASRMVNIPMSDACWGPYLQVASVNESFAAVNQVAAATLRLHLKSFLS